MEISTDGLDDGARFEVRDPEIDERAFFEPKGGAESYVVPLEPETDFEVDFEAEESVDRSREVSIDFRRLALTREDVWESDKDLTGVASDGGTVAATTESTIRTFDLAESGEPTRIAGCELERDASGVAGLDDLYVSHGAGGYEAFLVSDDRIERVASNDHPMEVLVADRHGDRNRVGFAVADGTVTPLDFEAPSDPAPVGEAETSLDQVHAGFAMGTQMVLAGQHGVEVWSIADVGAPELLDVLEIPDVTAVFCDDHQIHALTDDGTLSTFVRDGDGTARLGGAEFPDAWQSLHPRGTPALIGDRAVLRTRDRDRFNVFTSRVGRYGEQESGTGSGIDLDDLPKEIAEALTEIGMDIDDLLERTVGIDLIEEDKG